MAKPLSFEVAGFPPGEISYTDTDLHVQAQVVLHRGAFPIIAYLVLVRNHSMLSTGPTLACAAAKSPWTCFNYRDTTDRSLWPRSRCSVTKSQPLRRAVMAKLLRND